MKKIRQNVFETNSSSTHSICIAKTAELTIPKKLVFSFGEFGWENASLRSAEEKASYLITGLYANDRKDDFEKIKQILEQANIEVIIDQTPADDFYAEGYVDHSYGLKPFLDSICSDEYKLLKYLFSDLSFVLTGNDNSDQSVDLNVSYPHDSYFKGN